MSGPRKRALIASFLPELKAKPAASTLQVKAPEQDSEQPGRSETSDKLNPAAERNSTMMEKVCRQEGFNTIYTFRNWGEPCAAVWRSFFGRGARSLACPLEIMLVSAPSATLSCSCTRVAFTACPGDRSLRRVVLWDRCNQSQRSGHLAVLGRLNATRRRAAAISEPARVAHTGAESAQLQAI